MLAPSIIQALVRSDRRVVITGASGWLGLASLDLLSAALGPDFARRVVCFGSTERYLPLAAGGTIRQRPLADIDTLEPGPGLLLHYAFLTKDRAEQMAEADYRAANRAIGETVLPALDRIGIDRVFLASSGAAAHADDPAADTAMRLYGELKRDDEDRFAAWAEVRPEARRLAIARIFSLSGPRINKPEAYALASFIGDALAGRPIVVRAPMPVYRSYVAVREVLALALSALLASDGETVLRFDTGGRALELGALAQVVADVVGGQVQRATIVSPGENRYVGDEGRWTALLDRFALAHVPIAEQVAETATWLAHELDVAVAG